MTDAWKRWYDCVSCSFRAFFEDEKESRIKGWRRKRRRSRHFCPQCGQLREFLRPQKWGQKQQKKEILRSLSRRAYAHKKKQGVNPKKGGLYEPKREICPLPDAEDESAAGATLSGSGSRSLAGFIENAINFYLNYLSANNAGMFLPSSVQSYLDGRLDQMEKRVAALLYKQSVELDMGMSILADCVNLDEAYLRKKSAESAARVKKLNGHLQLEQMAKRAQEQRDSDDGWQD